MTDEDGTRAETSRDRPRAATLALAARARELSEQGRSIVDLSKGEPAYPTPDYAAEAGLRAIREGHTYYTENAGLPELREAQDYIEQKLEEQEREEIFRMKKIKAKKEAEEAKEREEQERDAEAQTVSADDD